MAPSHPTRHHIQSVSDHNRDLQAMEKRLPSPLPALLPPAAAASHQQQRPPHAQQQSAPVLDSSLLLLLSASSVAPSMAEAGLPMAEAGLPLPPVQALPLRVHLQPQQLHQQLLQSAPVLPMMLVPPPLLPQPIHRKRILPRIVATDDAASAVGAGGGLSGRPPPVPMPGRHPPLAVSSAVTIPSVTDTVALRSTGSNIPSAMDASAPDLSGAAGSSSTADEKPPKKKRIRIKTDRRREQCRTNQARYRNKQRGEAVDLEERVEKLRAEVGLLERQRQLQSRSLDISQAPMQTVMEYFRLFRYGLALEAQADEQLAFLRSVMVPDLRYGDFRGVDVLLEQWRRYSRYYGDLAFELESAFSVEKTAVESHCVSYTIHTAATLALTVTQATIEHVFPHVEPLVQLSAKLLGQRVWYPCSVVFEFDEVDKVQALVCSMDYVASLQQLLGNVLDVAELLANARIRRDFFLLGEDEEL